MSAVFISVADQRPTHDDEVAQLRIPPHSIEAEQSVLGGLLLDNGAWDRDRRPAHRRRLLPLRAPADLRARSARLINATKPADVITVFEQLQSLGKAEECGGLAYLNALAQNVPSAANIRRYAEIVRERAILRKLVARQRRDRHQRLQPAGPARSTQILDEAERQDLPHRRGGLARRARASRAWTSCVVAADRPRQRAARERRRATVTGVRTGFYDLDRMTSGLQPGDLIVLAARPSMGKTAFALNIAEHVARQRRPAGGRVLDGNGRVAARAAYGRLARPHRPEPPAHRRA